MSHLQQYLTHTSQNEQKSATIAYLAGLDHLEQAAPKVAGAIKQELIDQRSHLKLIASENYSSYSVQLAMGNWLTDKYAEGYPRHRFYAACENIDTVEEMAVNELKELFCASHAYVQPHSGADANLIALWAVLITRVQNKEMEKLGKKNIDELSSEEYESVRKLLVSQKMLGMSLNSGGHLTHGYRHNISSKMLQATLYDVDPKTELIDYQKLKEQAKACKPLILMTGYSAYPRRLNFAKMREIADGVGAVLMVDMAHFAGLVAGKALQGEEDPVPYAHIITSTTHKTLRGPRGGIILCDPEFEDAVNKGCPLVMGGPLPHVIAAKAIAFKEANSLAFRQYAKDVIDNAGALAERLKERGCKLVTDGTDNHLVVLKTASFGITGRQAELALLQAHLTVNRNAIPFDKNGPWYTSGVRLGTAAMTTLGMGKDEMRKIADLLVDTLSDVKPLCVEKNGQLSQAKYALDEKVLQKTLSGVRDLLEAFPLYPEIQLQSNLARIG